MTSENFNGKPISLSKERDAAQAERCKDRVPTGSNANEASRDAVTPVWNLSRPTPGTPSGTSRTVAPTGNLGAQVARTRSDDESDWSSNPPAGTRKTLTIKGVEYAFRYCPPGKFLMGAPWSEAGFSGISPFGEQQHYVILTKGFWTLETPVTQAMWRSIMGGNPSWFSSTGGGKKQVVNLDTSNFPVENVSWRDCHSFLDLWCESLDKGRYPLVKIDMLREAEWEYACRAGKDGPYSGESLDAMGWYRNNSGGRTHEARGKSANAWGLYDMHGNVLEWCADCKIRTYDNTVAEKVALQAPWKANVFNDDRILSRI